MNDLPEPEGPFAPGAWIASAGTVLPDWIDYNGHMNVAWYTHAFDKGLDELLDAVGCGPEAARVERFGPYALQTQYHYLGELVEGDRFRCGFQVLDRDAKRLHLWGEMANVGNGAPAALIETLLMCVDLDSRRSRPFPEGVNRRIDALVATQAGMARPDRAGAAIGIRRRGG